MLSYTISDQNFVANARKYHEGMFTNEDSDWYPVVEDQLKCSVNMHDKRQYYNSGKTQRSVTLTNDHMKKVSNMFAEAANHPTIEPSVQNLLKRPIKHSLCFFIYCLQSFTTNGNTLWNLFGNKNYSVHKDFLIRLAITICDDSNKFHHFLQFLKTENVLVTSPYKSYEVALKNNGNNGNNGSIGSIGDIPVHVFYDKPNSVGLLKYIENDEAKITNLYNFLVKMYPNDKNYDKLKHIKVVLDIKFNTTTCTVKKEDDDVGGVLFTNYKLKDLIKLVNLGNGYCYSCVYILEAIIGNYGNISHIHKGNENRKRIYRRISVFVKELDKRDDLFEFLEFYREKGTGPYNTESRTINKMLESFNKGSHPEETLDTLKSAFLKLVWYLLMDHQDEKASDSVRKIFLTTSNTLPELFGLCGYMCLADHISADEKAAITFPIASECLTELQKCVKDIGLEDVLTLEFNLGSNSLSYKHIMDKVQNTCIHGIGISFMKLYLLIYQKVVRFFNIIMDESNMNKDEMTSIVKLCPFVKEIPEKVSKLLPQNKQYKYYTCVKYDRDLITKQSYAVLAFSEDLVNHEYLFYIDIQPQHNTLKFMYNTAPYIYWTPYYLNIDSEKAIHAFKSNRMLGDILEIPFLFHRNRLATFKTFSNYCKTVCKNINSSEAKHVAIREKKELFDFVMVDTSYVPIKYRSVSKTNTNSEKGARWFNSVSNTNTSSIKNANETSDVIISSFETLMNLDYTKHETKGAMILHPLNKEKDITSTCQVARIIGKFYFGNNIRSVIERFRQFLSYAEACDVSLSFVNGIYTKDIKKDDNAFSIVGEKFTKVSYVNYHKILGELNKLYQKQHDNNIRAAMIHILFRSAVFELSFLLYCRFCIPDVLDYKDLEIFKRYSDPIIEFLENFFNFDTDTLESLKNKAEHIEDDVVNLYLQNIEPYMTFHNCILQDLVSFVCTESLTPAYRNVHFSEIWKEKALLEDLSSDINSMLNTILDTSLLDIKIEEKKPGLQEKIADYSSICTKTKDFLQRRLFYMNDNKLDVENYSYMDEDKLCYEYISKVHLMHAHKVRLLQFKMLQDFVLAKTLENIDLDITDNGQTKDTLVNLLEGYAVYYYNNPDDVVLNDLVNAFTDSLYA